MRKAIMLHHDFYRMIKMLTDEETGMLIKAVFEYDINGVHRDFEDRLLKCCYLRIVDFIEVNNRKYEQTCLKRIEAARIRWEREKAMKDNCSVS